MHDDREPNAATQGSASDADFLKFWVGQSVSNLGSSITLLAFPLLIYSRTQSALSLSLASISSLLPYLLFGLALGAWVDRVDRKRLMIWTDIGRAAVVGTVPLLAAFDALPIAWIYVVAFINSTLSIAFNAAEFAAIPSLVSGDDLVSANGRIQASYAAATVAGPLLAGVMIGFVSIETVVLIDACSYVLSALSLALVNRPFNAAIATPRTSIRADVVEGLRYVLGHPVLRNISIMMALMNFVAAPIFDQLVLFAERRLDAGESRVGILYSAASAGVVILSLAAGRVRKRWTFSRVALSALTIQGILIVVFALNTSFAIALPLVGTVAGLGVMFNINTGSLRQAIVPSRLLGRVITIASVLATSAAPLGSLIGGLAIDWTGNVALVYAVIGAAIVCIAGFFASFTPLGHAERYLPGGDLVLADSPADGPSDRARPHAVGSERHD